MARTWRHNLVNSMTQYLYPPPLIRHPQSVRNNIDPNMNGIIYKDGKELVYNKTTKQFDCIEPLTEESFEDLKIEKEPVSFITNTGLNGVIINPPGVFISNRGLYDPILEEKQKDSSKEEINLTSKTEIKEIPKVEVKEISKAEIKETPNAEIKETPNAKIKDVRTMEMKEILEWNPKESQKGLDETKKEIKPPAKEKLNKIEADPPKKKSFFNYKAIKKALIAGAKGPERGEIIMGLPDWVLGWCDSEPNKALINKLIEEQMKLDKNDHFYGVLNDMCDFLIGDITLKAQNIQNNSNIYCLHGPPGIGKTFLCKRIGKLIDYHVVIFSCTNLGNSDRADAYLKGSAYTYHDSAPGIIIRSLQETARLNKQGLIFVLDEIDKTEHADILLELLDAEQNTHFTDHYLGLDIDLSKVIFMLTCNQTDKLTPALKSRLDIITIKGYTREEKIKLILRTFTEDTSEKFYPSFAKFFLSNNLVNYVVVHPTTIPEAEGVRELFRFIKKLQNRYISFSTKYPSANDRDIFTHLDNYFHLTQHLASDK